MVKVVKWSDKLKPQNYTDFSNVKSDTDQRCILNTPAELWDSFVAGDVIDEEEFENEKIEDFDKDVYPYEDRTELGIDIALAHSITTPSVSLQKKKKTS